MPSLDSTPGGRGVEAIVAATLGASVIMTLVTGTVWHWPFVLAGIASGLMAAKSVR